MKLCVLYRPNSEHARIVENYAENFKRLYPTKEVELVDIDGREGSEQAKLYDIVQYPAILAIADNGSLLSMWAGDILPTTDEVLGYIAQ